MKSWIITTTFLTASLFTPVICNQEMTPALPQGISTKAESIEKIDDRSFLRRVWLDITGTLPDRPHVEGFLANRSPLKYSQEIDRLLASDAFTYRWTTFFEDLFQVRALIFERPAFRNGFHNMLQDKVKNNQPLDAMVRDILTGTGAVGQQSSMFLWLQDAFEEEYRLDFLDDQAALISDSLLGIQTRCISCHDGKYHLETVNVGLSQMTREGFWGLSAMLASTHFYISYENYENYNPEDPYYFFDILELVDIDHPSFNEESGELELFDVVYDEEGNINYAMSGQYLAQSAAGQGMRPPRAGGTIAPVYPFSGKGPLPGETRRQALARELTADPQFARNFVNRIWAHFFGEGFVEPLNSWDLARLDAATATANNTTVQARDPELMTFLTNWFMSNNYNLKAFIRLIANSKLYQYNYAAVTPDQVLTSGDTRWAWWRNSNRVRRVDAETVVDTMSQILGLQPRYLITGYGENLYTSAWQMPDPSEPGYLGVFTEDGQLRVDPRKLGFYSEEEIFFYLESAQEIMRQFGRGDYVEGSPRNNENNIQNALLLMNGWINFWISEWEFHPGIVSRVTQLEQGKYSTEQTVIRLYQDMLFRDPTAGELSIVLNHARNKDEARVVTDLMWALFNHPDFLHR